MVISLKELQFGVPAAERDENLIACFVSSEIYKKLAQGQKAIILGNRGVGKSALFRKLADDEVRKGNIIVDRKSVV